MSLARILRPSFLACLLLASAAFGKEITLPPETLEWRSSDLPGYALVQQNCRTCHSAHYAEYQPWTSPRTYWEAQVKRMKAVFKAPLRDEDLPAYVDYLVKTYGAEASR